MRRQLAVLVASTTSVVVIAFLIPLALLVRELAEDRAVAAATQEAQNVAFVVGVLDDQSGLRALVDTTNARSDRVTTVFLPDGGRVGAPATRSSDVQAAAEGTGSSQRVDGGYEVLQPVALADGLAVIRTFVPEDQLRRGVTRTWLVLLGLGLALLVVAQVVADRLARRVTRPLQELVEATHSLGEGRLDTRVEPVGPPEVVELGTVVNRLARRIRELLAAERELVADLSHRLRTPITALRLDTESLRDPDEAERLGADVDELERAVTDVIRDARRLPDAAAKVDASPVVRERVAFWAALADDQERPLQLGVESGELVVGLSGPDLAAAVDALLENALSHTPDGTPVRVRLSARDGGGAVLVVEDDGPGFGDLAPMQRGASGGGSTGLGLDIVRRTAEASGGLLRLAASGTGGALAHVELGPPAAPE